MATLHDILRFRVDEDGGKERIQKALSKTKWLERYADNPEDITLEVLESLYKAVVKKYNGGIGYIQNAGDGSMVCMIKRYDDHKWITSIYFITFWEMMAKLILALYGHYIKGIIFQE